MGWGNSWIIPTGKLLDHADLTAGVAVSRVGLDLDNGADKTVVTKVTAEKVELTEFYKVYNNKVPTHDPYTNPNAQLYHECDCGEILDPGTKRFAELNNEASRQNWVIKWGAQHYQAYCPKCVKEKGIEE